MIEYIEEDKKEVMEITGLDKEKKESQEREKQTMKNLLCLKCWQMAWQIATLRLPLRMKLNCTLITMALPILSL